MGVLFDQDTIPAISSERALHITECVASEFPADGIQLFNIHIFNCKVSPHFESLLRKDMYIN